MHAQSEKAARGGGGAGGCLEEGGVEGQARGNDHWVCSVRKLKIMPHECFPLENNLIRK